MKQFMLLLVPFVLYGGNLEELLKDAIDNKLVQSSNLQVESAQEQFNALKGSYQPQINLGATYSKANKEIVSTPDNSIVSFASIDYTLYDGGTKSDRYDASKATIEQNKQSNKALKNSISLEVVKIYFNYLSSLAQYKSVEDEIATLSAEEKRLKNFLDVGKVTIDEVAKIESAKASANVSLSEIELTMETLLHSLSYISNQNTTIIDGSKIKNGIKQETKRADIKALEFNTKQLQNSANSIKGNNYPKITLNNTYYKYDMNYDNKDYTSALDEQNIFQVNLQWNIFDFGATNDSYNSAYKQYLSAKSNLEYEKSKADVDLQLAKKAYEIAQYKIKSARLGLDAANKTYETVALKYKNGLVDNVAYLDALREKSKAFSTAQKAKNDLEITKANILYHEGKNIWEYIQ